MAPSRLRNTSDILRSRVSPWWRIPRSTRSLARWMLEKQRFARQVQHVRLWGLSTLSRCQLTGDSTPQPSRTSRLPSALPTSRIGPLPSKHDTSGFPCTCASCHHARLAALLVTCATQDQSPSDHVGVIARPGRHLDLSGARRGEEPARTSRNLALPAICDIRCGPSLHGVTLRKSFIGVNLGPMQRDDEAIA
jgi:hypothetical protein